MATGKLKTEPLELTISYLYLLFYCPPGQMPLFKQAGALLRQGMAIQAGMEEAELFKQVIPEACWRVVAFHERSREPHPQLVEMLTTTALSAQDNPQNAARYVSLMEDITFLHGRAKAENRLRRDKGCQFCTAPCHYGFFSLVSEPRYQFLFALLKAETLGKAGQPDPIQAAWAFARSHLWRSLGIEQSFITRENLANLAYCLLVLGTARSRYPFPQAQFLAIQRVNQALIS